MLGNIDKSLLPMKAHYFLYNAATSPIVIFLPTMAKQMGFSGLDVGIISIGLIAKPLFGIAADKFRLHKAFFLAFQAILTVAFFSIYFIPTKQPIQSAKVHFMCDHNEAFFRIDLPKNHIKNDPSDTFNATCNAACAASDVAYKELCLTSKLPQFCNRANRNVVTGETVDFEATFHRSEALDTSENFHIKTVSFGTDSRKYYLQCNSSWQANCTINCPTTPQMEKIFKELSDNQTNSRKAYEFHFLFAAIFTWMGMAVVVSISDAICIDLLGDENGNHYGKQKMWGSIGFGIFGIGSGYLLDHFSAGKSDTDYSCIFFIALVIMILDIMTSTTLKKKSTTASDIEPSILWELRNVITEFRVQVFIFWCIGAGICTGFVWNFLFWYTEEVVVGEDKNWLKTLQGLMTGVQCFLGELPFNFISGWVLKKFGHINVMSLVLLAYAVRFMAYSIIRNMWLFLIVELLHGPTLGLSWPTMVAYGDKIAPSGTRATMQGFVGAIFEGIGVLSGSLICGKLMDTYKGVTTCQIFSVIALVWLTIYWILQLLLRRAKAHPIHQGHSHLASYATPNDAILMTMNQELQTY